MVIGEPLPSWMLFYPALIIIIVLATLWKYITQKPVVIGFVFFLLHIALVLHNIMDEIDTQNKTNIINK